MGLANPNIFDYIGKKTDEKKIHEKFIASLLQNEDLGPQVWKKIKNKIATANNDIYTNKLQHDEILSQTVTEQYYLGSRPADILFQTNNNRPIILELKIDSKDEEAQLWDYYTVAKYLFGKDPIIIYLTLDGRAPNKCSINYIDSSPIKDNINFTINSEFYCLSYNDLVDGLNTQNQTNPIKNNSLLEFLLSQYIKLLDELKKRGKNRNLSASDYNYFINTMHEELQRKRIECHEPETIKKKGNPTQYRITIPHPKNSEVQLCLSSFSDNSTKHHIYYGFIKNKIKQWKLSDYEHYVKHILWQCKTIYINEKNHPADYPSYKNFDKVKEKIKDKKKLNFDFLFYQNDIAKYLLEYEDYCELSISEFAKIFASWIYYDYCCLK